MERIKLVNDIELSRLVYGMWRLGDDQDTSSSHVRAKIDACLSQGISTFDQADIYGDYSSESILGAALSESPSLRNNMEIVTKCDIMLLSNKFPDRKVKYYDTSAAHIQASVEQSLTNMATDRIDLLLLHRPDPLMDHEETGQALDALVSSGKVRGIGVSNFMPHDWSLLQSAMQQPLLTNQLEISLMHNEYLTDGTVAHLQENGKPPMAWSPLGGGQLFDQNDQNMSTLRLALDHVANEQNVDIAAVAIAWLLHHPARLLPVLGTNNIDRIASLADACKVSLTREQWFALYEAANGHEVP